MGAAAEWHDKDNVRHQWAMPLELLQGDGVDVRRELARLGLTISTNKKGRDLLASFLQVWPVENRARCVERLGWHGGVFVTPAESIGQDGEIVVFQNAHAIEPAYSVAGSVEEWRDSADWPPVIPPGVRLVRCIRGRIGRRGGRRIPGASISGAHHRRQDYRS